MMVRKLTLCAGAGILWALATPVNTTWMATLSSVGGSNVTGTATVDVGDSAAPSMNKPSMQKPDTTKVPGDTGRQGKPYQAQPDHSHTPADTREGVKSGIGQGKTQARFLTIPGRRGEDRGPRSRSTAPLRVSIPGSSAPAAAAPRHCRSRPPIRPPGGPPKAVALPGPMFPSSRKWEESIR